MATETRYSIKDLENFTQIKAHTIRIWEQRYGLLNPKRTETNIRYYSEDDLKKILNINLLYNSGKKISKIAALSEQEILNSSKNLILISDTEQQSDIDAITLLILDFKSDEIHKYLTNKIETIKLEDLYEKIILPLLVKLGQLWQVNSIDIIHEHFFSNIFKNFLLVQIDQLHVDEKTTRKAILFLHSREEHEFSILLYYYLLKRNNFSCYYFGQKVPIAEVKNAFNQIKPTHVVTTFTAKISDKNFRKLEEELKRFSKSAVVIVSGSQLYKLEEGISKKIIQVDSVESLNKIID